MDILSGCKGENDTAFFCTCAPIAHLTKEREKKCHARRRSGEAVYVADPPH